MQWLIIAARHCTSDDAVAVDKIEHLVVCKTLITPDEASGKL
jgi:hypothetical protein